MRSRDVLAMNILPAAGVIPISSCLHAVGDEKYFEGLPGSNLRMVTH